MTTATTTKHILVIIDSAIDDHQILAQGILPTAEVIVLNKHQDGIAQISALCKNHPAVGIQIIAHGSPGNLQLGNSQLNLANLHTYRQQLQQWKAAEILIYGCEVAAGETGKTFIEQLHQLTGANIAASAQKIGNPQQGGTWELEVNIGQIASTLALKSEIREAYTGIFATFDTATNFTVGTNPKSVTVGDFNGDGKLDLAVANYNSNTVSVLLGTATGGFAAATNFTVGTNPRSVAVGDFNGDGKLDLAVANNGSKTVSLLLGNGTGGFAAATNFTVGTNPRSVAVGDFNGDGKLDLAVANNGSKTVSVLLGNGTGGFAAATNFTVGTNPRSVTVGDFNGDGKLDLATANFNSNTVSVLLGLGTGGFVAATNFTVGTNPFSVTVGDFNGDGKVDLATANEGSNTVSVLLGLGTGGFATATNFTVGNTPRSAKVGDFNGDGKLDLAVANYNSNTVSVLLGLGTGGFATATNFTVGTNPFSVTVRDFNGDGKLDLATANEGSNNVSVLLNTTPKITITASTNPKEGGATGSFTITLDTAAPVGGLVVNFNTTGSTATATTDYSLAAGANITAVTANTFTIAAGTTTATLAVTAVTDGISDPKETVTVNLESSPDYILGASSTANFQPATNFSVGSKPYSVTEGDFNADGNLDLAVANYGDNTVSVLLGDGAGGFVTATNISVGTKPTSVTEGDFNGDGKLDLAVANFGDNTVSVLLTGGFGTTTKISVGSKPYSVIEGDFNGDGNLDLATANYGSNTVSVLLGNGTGGFGSATDFTVGNNPYSVTEGDFNADGKLDLAAANFSDNTVSVLLGDGTGAFGTPTNFSVGNKPDSVTVGDFNGDGKLDLAATNYGDNTVSVLLSIGTGGFGTATNFSVGSKPYLVRVGDFNSDGKLDLAATNYGDNTVSVLLGTGTGGFGTATNFSVGTGPSSVAVGDFNGDGKLDLAATNYGDNTVSVLLNVTSATLTIAEPTRLTNPNDDVFNITGQDVKTTLEVKLTGHNSPLVNELGLFTVDDPQGTINGIAPAAEGYAQAAILRSQVILSAIANNPNGFDTNNLTRLLQLNSGQNFRFLLVQDGTLDAVRNDPNSIGKLLFSSVSTQKITDLGDNSFSLGWKDASGKSSTDFNDLVVKINQTDQALPLGTNLQGEFQGELIDLRDVQQSVEAEFNVYREASYNNYVGFYQVTDENGGIDTNGDGIADVLTGQAGYTQAAVRGKIAGIDLSVSNQGSATYNGVFQPGAIFAPFIIVNATPDTLLDDNSSNDPAVYFPFLGANSDHTDHISLLASNTFGFEDLANGGDKDFNDLIIKVNLATTI
ncbi:FG-GAP-like repeat-containing protein [Nostoc sp.]|uniref:FG-GAP-like repeat-containing protein n=1 Tax=Nostoc sp. TaxID=1180 RepID=UPI002FEFDA43